MVLFYFGHTNALAGRYCSEPLACKPRKMPVEALAFSTDISKSLTRKGALIRSSIAATRFSQRVERFYKVPKRTSGAIFRPKITGISATVKADKEAYEARLAVVCKDFSCTRSEGTCILRTFLQKERSASGFYQRQQKRAAAQRKAESLRKQAREEADAKQQLASLRAKEYARNYAKRLKRRIEGNDSVLPLEEEAILIAKIREEWSASQERADFLRKMKRQRRLWKKMARYAAMKRAAQEATDLLSFVEKVQAIPRSVSAVKTLKNRRACLDTALSCLHEQKAEGEFTFLGFDLHNEVEAGKFLLRLLHFQTQLNTPVYMLESRVPWHKAPEDVMGAIEFYWNNYILALYDSCDAKIPYSVRKNMPECAVGNAPWGALTSIVPTILDWCKMSYFANLVDRTREALESVLSNFLSRLGGLVPMFWQLVDRLSGEVKKLLQDHWFAITVASSLIMSFCLFIGTLIAVGLFCKLVSYIGFGPAMVTGLVTVLGGAFLGVYGLLSFYDKSWDDMLAKIVNFFCSKDVLSDGEDNVAIGNAATDIFSPFWWLLTKLVPAVQMSKAGPIVGMGQLGNSMGGISKLCTNFKEFGGNFLDYLSRVADSFCNFSGGAIRSINLMLSEDFTEWCDEIEKFATDTWESLCVSRLFKLKKLRSLKDREKQFQLAFLDPQKKMPILAVHMFEKARTQLNEALRTLGICRFLDTPKGTPFSIWLYSQASGTGKSTAQKRLMDSLLDTIGFPNYCRHYQRGNGLRHWDNYEHQYVCAFDDLSAVPDTELEWFQVITDDRIPLSKAAIADKGMIFTSDFVVASSNMLSCRPDSMVGSVEAFDNRRHIMLELKKNPDYEASKGCRNYSLYSLRHPTQSGYPYMDKFMNMVNTPIWYTEEEINDVLYTAYRSHHMRCSAAFPNGSEMSSDCNQDNTVADFFFLLKEKLKWENFGAYSVEDVSLFVNSLKSYDQHVGFTFKKEVIEGDQRVRFRMEDIKCNLDTLIADDLLQDCMAFLPSTTKAYFYQAIVEESDYPFSTASLYHPFELYVFHRLRRAKTMSVGGTRLGFSKTMQDFRNQLKSLYDRVLEKAPSYFKFLLGVGFFFLFGYGFYMACKRITSACTCISSLGAALAVGNASAGANLQKSGDMTIKQKEKEQNVRYVRATVPFKPGSWALETEDWAEGNGPSDQQRHEAIDSFAYLSNYVCSLVRDSNGSIYKGYMLGGRTMLMVKHVWDHYLTSGLYRFWKGGMSTRVEIVKSYIQTISIEGKDLIMIKLPLAIPESDDGGFKLLPKDDSSVPRMGPVYCFSPEFIDKRVINVAKIFTEFYDCQKFERYAIGSQRVPVTPGCSYKSDLSFADCGSVVFFPGKGREDSKPIPGLMHVADGKLAGEVSRTGVGIFITQSDCLQWKRLSPTHAAGNGPQIISCNNTLQEACVRELGQLSLSDCPHVSGKTQLLPSLISPLIEVPNTVVPAIISNDDPRIKESSNPEFDVFKCGMDKYSEMAGPMTIGEADDTEDFHDCFGDIFECLTDFEGEEEEKKRELFEEATSLKVVSTDVALNGRIGEEYFDSITSGTSEGYPWTLHRPKGCKGKGWLLDGAPGAWSLNPESEFGRSFCELEEQYRSGINPVLIGVDHPKDETVELKKVTTAPKTRLFTVLPFGYNLMVRKYFLEFVVFYMRQHNRCPGKVGINPTSIEWQIFQEKLRAMGQNWFNGDFKRFDGITPRDVLVCIANSINKLYVAKDTTTLRVDNMVRRSLLLSASDRLGIAGRSLYKVNSGIPSGFALTVIINSLVNEFFLRYAWKRLVRESLKPEWVDRSVFQRHVAFGVYGDDNLVSVSDVAKNIFNLVTISSFLKRFGVTLVNGQCKDEIDFPPFSPDASMCDFLKRRMVLSATTGRILAPLALPSIYGRLHWIRDTEDRGAATVENCSSALYEAYHHGESFFHDLRRKIFSSCKGVGLPTSELPTYKECEARFLANKSMIHGDFDVPVASILATDTFVEVYPRVFLAGICANRNFFDGKYVIWCGSTHLRKPFVNEEIVCASNGGYCSRAYYLQKICEISTDKPIVFLSSDGMSHAIPPVCIYLWKRKQVSLTRIHALRAMCGKNTGTINSEWSKVLDLQDTSIQCFNIPEDFAPELNKEFVDMPNFLANPSLKVCMNVMLSKAKDKEVFPFMYSHQSFLFRDGTPGTMFSSLDSTSSTWHKYAGQNANIVYSLGFVCHEKCPGHILERNVKCKIVRLGEEKEEYNCFWDFITIDSSFVDPCSNKLQVLSLLLKELKKQTCIDINF